MLKSVLQKSDPLPFCSKRSHWPRCSGGRKAFNKPSFTLIDKTKLQRASIPPILRARRSQAAEQKKSGKIYNQIVAHSRNMIGESSRSTRSAIGDMRAYYIIILGRLSFPQNMGIANPKITLAGLSMHTRSNWGSGA